MSILADSLTLEVTDLEVPVLTGIYSEETHLPQPLRISVAPQARNIRVVVGSGITGQERPLHPIRVTVLEHLPIHQHSA